MAPCTTRELLSITENVSRTWTHWARKLAKESGAQFRAHIGDSYLDGHMIFEHMNIASQGRLLASMGGQNPHNLARQYHHMLRWRQFGYPVFRPTHSLCSALILTDCGGIKASDLVTPFGSFVIDLPYPNPLISFTHFEDPTRQIPARAITVHFYQSFRDDASADAFNRSRDLHNQSIELSQKGQREEAAKAKQESLATAGLMQFDPWVNIRMISEDGYDASTDWPLPKGDDYLRSIMFRDDDDGEVVGYLAETDKHALNAAVRLVVNLCLYVTNQPAQESPWKNHSGATTKRDRDDAPEPATWLIGREIKLPRTMVDAARAFAENGTGRSAWKIRSRFTVCGHWRNQACGKEHQDRKRMWIQPYWKGPADGVALTKLYSVELPTPPTDGETP